MVDMTMNTERNNDTDGRSPVTMKRFGLLLAACFVGVPMLAAPVLGQGASFRPLTIGHSIKVAQAYGPDDEDCVFVTRRVPRPNGLTHPSRKLLCNE